MTSKRYYLGRKRERWGGRGSKGLELIHVLQNWTKSGSGKNHIKCLFSPVLASNIHLPSSARFRIPPPFSQPAVISVARFSVDLKVETLALLIVGGTGRAQDALARRTILVVVVATCFHIISMSTLIRWQEQME